MDDMSDFWRIVSGGRAESTRQRLERHDRRMSRLYRLLALPLIVGGLTVMLTPGLNTWWNDRTLTHEAHAVETLSQDGVGRQVKAARDYNKRMVGRQYQIGEVLNPDGTRLTMGWAMCTALRCRSAARTRAPSYRGIRTWPARPCSPDWTS